MSIALPIKPANYFYNHQGLRHEHLKKKNADKMNSCVAKGQANAHKTKTIESVDQIKLKVKGTLFKIKRRSFCATKVITLLVI